LHGAIRSLVVTGVVMLGSVRRDETREVELDVPFGVPYRPSRYPTNYAYLLTVGTTAGWVPYLERPPSLDPRFLGVMIRLTPVYLETP
jgi:hypothetical protein